MSLLDSLRRRSGRSTERGYSASVDAARRATRARNHLERKRVQERRRRERRRVDADRRTRQSPLRSTLALSTFVAALAAGLFVAVPLNERIPFQSTAFTSVDIQGASTLSPEKIFQVAGLHEQQVHENFEINRIVFALETEPWIESARAFRLPTGTLMISVVERDAIAVWKTDIESPPLLVDERGEPFAGALEPGGPLPLVSGSSSEEDASLPHDAIEILRALEQFSSLTQNPRSLTLFLPSSELTATTPEDGEQTGYVLQFGSDGPRALLGRTLFEERVARLAALVESGEPTILAAQSIDLRYADRAVLRTEPVSG